MDVRSAKRLFGTDGIRGVAGQFPLDEYTVYAVGQALAESLRTVTAQPNVLIGMDTRESSLPLAGLLAGGLEEGGAQVRSAGVIPTAAVAHLTAHNGFAAGVMLSASHNAFQDNGIKVFGPSGYKLSDAEEKALETQILKRLDAELQPHLTEIPAEASFSAQYLDHLLAVESLPDGLPELKVVVDCANGAACFVAPWLFERLGVRAEVIANEPDGRNINLHCGSLHLDKLQEKVVASGAQWGVALDGDADRALFVAGDGTLVDGDALLLISADHLARHGRLVNNLVVTTLMANLGLEKALGERGIRMVRTPVGDKYVLEEMLRSGAVLGGEQSGHVIFREYATTGDGLLTARMILQVLAESAKPLGELRKQLRVFPQELKNLSVREKIPFDQLPALRQALSDSEQKLGDRGRVVVRYSGTEPLLRIMVEAEDAALVKEQIDVLTQVFQQQLGS